MDWKRITRAPLATLLIAAGAGGAGAVPAAHAANMAGHGRVLSPAPAASPVARPAAIAVSPTTVESGGRVLIGVYGFARDEVVRVALSGLAPTLAVFRVDTGGSYGKYPAIIPAGIAPGRHILTARGSVSRRLARTTIEVIAPTPTPTRPVPTPTRRPPTATPRPRPTATSRPTAMPAVRAAIAVAPLVVNRGGLVTVSGAGFDPRELIRIYFYALPRAVTLARATTTGLLAPTGISVPYALAIGAHHIIAYGVTSRRSASALVTVRALTPSLALSPTTASPGGIVTATGRGFGPGEQVTLSLNGAALITSPARIVAAGGSFTATFKTPASILDGPNTVSAIGNQSRVAAVAQLNGVLPISARFYFAGGMNTATEHSFVDLLNPNGQPAKATLTFYFDNGQTGQQVVSVAPTSQQTISVAGFGYPPGTFGLSVEANRRISAQIVINRDGEDGDTLLGNTGLGTTWYLAEGYTGLTFHESVSIFNPDPNTAASVQLQLLPFGGRTARTIAVTAAPHANTVVDVNALMPNQSLSIIATSDRPVVVERTLTFSSDGYGLTTRAGTNLPATTWLFAEGTTANRFQTFLTILNPNNAPAQVTASFYGQTGGSLGSKTLQVDPRSRANIKLNDFLSASGIASVVTSNLPVVVERPEYFGPPNDAGIAGSDVFGQNGAAPRWSFPGGDTSAGMSEFLLIYNPSPVSVTIAATLYGSNGSTATRRVVVPPTVRYNLDIGTLVPNFDPAHGVNLRSVSGQGFIAEQTEFAQNYSSLRSTQGLAQ